MASSSEEKAIVTNGMSYYNRDKENSNAALLVNVEPRDFYKSSPLDGLDFKNIMKDKHLIWQMIIELLQI